MLFGFDFFSKWKPGPEEFTAPLTVPLPFRFKLYRLPKGIDNAHIDVILSRQLMDAARRLVRTMVESEVNEHLALGWEWAAAPAVEDIEAFRKTYRGVMEAGLAIARKTARREPVQLAQFAVLKALLMLVDGEMALFRDDLQQQRSHGQRSNRVSVQIHDRLVAYSRAGPAIRGQVARQLLSQILRLESTSLRRLRKSVLGHSWPVPRELLFNPMLALASLWDEEQVMRHYPLVGIRREPLEEFAAVNGVLVGLFADYLPEWARPRAAAEPVSPGGEAPLSALQLRTDQGALAGFLEVELLLGRALREDEYRYGRTSWLDDPANLAAVLRAEVAPHPSGWSAAERPPTAPFVRGKQGMAFCVRLIREAQSRFEGLGVLKKIYAAHKAPAIFDDLRQQVPVALIVEYLEGRISRPRMSRRLDNLRSVAETDLALRCLDTGKSAVRNLSLSDRRRCVVDFLIGFARLRRDLKLAYRAYRIMDQIRILQEPADIELSRSNRSLHELLLPEEQSAERREIRGHAILKADLRGSSRITRELRNRKLNPATHFSLNFFSPINGQLARFGAKKVFVEGDAVILGLYEYEDGSTDWLAVCRAAGLARKILEVVDTQNAQNRKYNLPELELGLGIAWVDEAPAFLYDEDHEIMISPAINRADRLSSCAASLRETELGRRRPRGVEVVVPVNQGIMQKDSGDRLLRYNVNGIELDPAAFPKLQQELVLRRVEAEFPEYGPGSVFHVGRYPDRTGFMQWLAVREAPVRRWEGNEVSGEEPEGRRFYEIVTHPEVLERLKQELTVGAQVARLVETILSPEV
jgi:class 3 adenylate cyclase